MEYSLRFVYKTTITQDVQVSPLPSGFLPGIHFQMYECFLVAIGNKESFADEFFGDVLVGLGGLFLPGCNLFDFGQELLDGRRLCILKAQGFVVVDFQGGALHK